MFRNIEETNEHIEKFDNDEDLYLSEISLEFNSPLKKIFNNEKEQISKNLISDYDLTKFKTNRYNFENSIMNNFYYLQNKEAYQSTKLIFKPFFDHLTIYQDEYRKIKQIQNLKITEESFQREENETVSDMNEKENDKCDINNLLPYLNYDQYYNFIFIFLFLKYTSFENKFIFRSTTENIFDTMMKEKNIKKWKKAINNLNKDILEDKELIEVLKSSDTNFMNEQEYKKSCVEIIQKYGDIYNSCNKYLFGFIEIVNNVKLKEETKLYPTWKRIFGKLIALWDYKNKTGFHQRYNIKVLKLKILLIKIFRKKEKGKIFHFSEVKKKIKIDDDILQIPNLTFTPDETFTVLFDFIVDISILYTIFIYPMISVLQIKHYMINSLDQLTSGIYLINIFRIMRTIFNDNMNLLQTNLWKILKYHLKSFKIYTDIISIFPFDLLVNENNPDYINPGYIQLRTINLLRILRFGNSFAYLEKTKYALVYRIIALMGVFLFIVHWLGLFLVSFFNSYFYSKDYPFIESCFTNDLLSVIKPSCIYLEALYSGGFVIPGKTISTINFTDEVIKSSQLVYIFFCYFIGQIITAYVFSGVADLINSLNQAENKFQYIMETHRLTGQYYKYNEEVFRDVQMYYEYLWNRHREKIYGIDNFKDLSRDLSKKLKKSMISNYKFLFKDFFRLKSKDNKFLIHIINNLNKYIAFPYERLLTQGLVIPGLFILEHGSVYIIDEPALTKTKKKYDFLMKDGQFLLNCEEIIVRHGNTRYDLQDEFIINRYKFKEKELSSQYLKYDQHIQKTKIIFPVESLFLKTGRSIETCYVKEFCDLYLLNLDYIDSILMKNFPEEFQKLGLEAKQQGLKKIGTDKGLLEIIGEHSSRSVGRFYESKYNKSNMWIEFKTILPKYKIKGFTFYNMTELLSDQWFPGLFEVNFINVRVLSNKICNNKKLN